jgi:hypothetical protein
MSRWHPFQPVAVFPSSATAVVQGAAVRPQSSNPPARLTNSNHPDQSTAAKTASVKGYPTGFGNPTWLATHPDPAAAHAPPVQALLDAGAMIVGGYHIKAG